MEKNFDLTLGAANAPIENVATEANTELNELHLALIGGGIGDVIWA